MKNELLQGYVKGATAAAVVSSISFAAITFFMHRQLKKEEQHYQETMSDLIDELGAYESERKAAMRSEKEESIVVKEDTLNKNRSKGKMVSVNELIEALKFILEVEGEISFADFKKRIPTLFDLCEFDLEKTASTPDECMYEWRCRYLIGDKNFPSDEIAYENYTIKLRKTP